MKSILAFGILVLVFVVGMALVAYGTWLIYPPAAYIVVGVTLLFDLYRWAGWRRSNERHREDSQ